MPSAEIITLGTEILLGEIVDTNSAYLARHLRDLNINVFRTSTVGDNAARIAEIIRETLTRADIIITTGGLGPTIDDPTREAVAQAFGVPTEFRPELWEQIIERMKRFGRTPGENQKRQAYVPQGAIGVQNLVGTAPAFIVEQGQKCVISLPGVPKEMEYLTEHEIFPYLRRRYNLSGTIKARILHTSGMGESVIDEKIGDLETLSNPTVGLAAHYGIVDIRITAKSESEEAANQLLNETEQTLRQRLGNIIYGVDKQTLESVAMEALTQRGYTLSSVEINTGGELSRKLSATQSPLFLGGQILPHLPEGQTLQDLAAAQQAASGATLALGLRSNPTEGAAEVEIVLLAPGKQSQKTLGYGGHPKNLSAWGANTALNLLRKVE